MSNYKREIVEIDEDLCDGCELCIPSCAEGAIQMINGKAKLVNDALCDGIGDCLGECPQGAITITHRDAPAFDEKLVEQHLKLLEGGSAEVQSVQNETPVPPVAAAPSGG